MTKEQIGSILKELRLQTGKTQKEVAEILGRKQPIIGHWETGYAQPDANTLFTLCDIYGTTVDAAFGFKKKDISISKDDLKLIERYHALDSFGRETVDITLDRETSRMEQLQEKDSRIAELEAKPTTIIGMQAHPSTAKRLISYYYKNASAGTGQIIFDNPPSEDIEIPDIPKYRCVSYAIGVNGNSMEPVYHDGDILLVEATREIQIGQIGIFQLNGECFVKKLGKEELISLNDDYDNIPLNESTTILGRVIDTVQR